MFGHISTLYTERLMWYLLTDAWMGQKQNMKKEAAASLTSNTILLRKKNFVRIKSENI